MKRGFSLVELLVVIGILAVLMSVAVPQIGKARESARTAQCMSNMRTLAQGCYNAAMEKSYETYPFAGSAEYTKFMTPPGENEERVVYCEHKGWLSWLSEDYYARYPSEHRQNNVAGWGSSEKEVEFAITNGAIWKAVGGNRSCYVCPEIARVNPKIGWTYVMNSRFGYDSSHGSDTTSTQDSGIRANGLARADRILMFAEIDFSNGSGGGGGGTDQLGSNKTSGSNTSGAKGGGTGTKADGVLEYDDGESSERERIGFHHISGRKLCGHIAFADCHVERLEKPEKGDLDELTKWLCEGYDITNEGGAYKRIEESQDE